MSVKLAFHANKLVSTLKEVISVTALVDTQQMAPFVEVSTSNNHLLIVELVRCPL